MNQLIPAKFLTHRIVRYNKIEVFLKPLSFEVVYYVEICSWYKIPQPESPERKKKDIRE